MRRLSAKLFLWERKHGFLCVLTVFALLLFSAGLLLCASYSTDMTKMFPAESQSRKVLDTVMNSGLLNRAAVYFTNSDGSAFDSPDKLAFLEPLAEELNTAPLVRSAVFRANALPAGEAMRDFAEYLPQFVSVRTIQTQTPESLRKAMDKALTQIALLPMAGRSLVEYDPLSMQTPYFRKLEKLLLISGFHFDSGSGVFLSEDGLHCMMIVLTGASSTDSRQCAEFLEQVRAGLRKFTPSGVKAEIFSAHTHMEVNEASAKKDLKMFGMTSVVLFTLVFGILYRFDWKGMAIPLIPAAGGVIAAAVLSILFQSVLVFTIGIGGVLIGLGGDYGIHLYAAARSRSAVRNGIRLVPPLFFAFLTSAFAFFCFIFTGVPVFEQFGVFSFLTLAWTFLLMVFLLPGFLFAKDTKRKILVFHFSEKLWSRPRLTLGVFCAVFLLLLYGCFLAKYDPDIRKFDMASGASAEREKVHRNAFLKGREPVPVLYRAETSDALLDQMSSEAERIRNVFPDAEFVSASDLVPSESWRLKNLTEWKSFVNSDAWKTFTEQFQTAAEDAGFERSFFAPFLNTLENAVQHPRPGLPKVLQYATSSLFGQSARPAGMMLFARTSSGKLPDALCEIRNGTILEETRLAGQLYTDLCGNMREIGAVCILAVLLCIALYLRSGKKFLAAILPLCCCLIAVPGVHGLTGTPLTLSVLISCIITVGISVDYGILLAASGNGINKTDLLNAVTFSAVTTIAGGATVIFMCHPMIRTAGLTIITGITAAWCVSVFLLPLLLKKKTLPLLLAAAVLAMSASCSYEPFGTRPPIEPLPANVKGIPPRDRRGDFTASAVLTYPLFGRVTFLLAGTRMKYTTEIIGLTPAGFRVFELAGQKRTLLKHEWREGILSAERAEMVSGFVFRAVVSYLDNAEAESVFTGPSGEEYDRIFYRKGKEIGRISFFPTGKNAEVCYIYEEPRNVCRLYVRLEHLE